MVQPIRYEQCGDHLVVHLDPPSQDLADQGTHRGCGGLHRGIAGDLLLPQTLRQQPDLGALSTPVDPLQRDEPSHFVFHLSLYILFHLIQTSPVLILYTRSLRFVSPTLVLACFYHPITILSPCIALSIRPLPPILIQMVILPDEHPGQGRYGDASLLQPLQDLLQGLRGILCAAMEPQDAPRSQGCIFQDLGRKLLRTIVLPVIGVII